MKKTKQIDTYYCDYCGKECKHTPEYVLPSQETIYAKNHTGNTVLRFDNPNYIEAVQKDICPECQKQIAKLVNLLHYADFVCDDMEKMVYVLLKKQKLGNKKDR